MKPRTEDEEVASTAAASTAGVLEDGAELSDGESSCPPSAAIRTDTPPSSRCLARRSSGLSWVRSHTLHESIHTKTRVMEAARSLGWESRKADKLKDTYVVPSEPPTIFRILAIPFVIVGGEMNVLLCFKSGRCEPPGGTLDDLDVSLAPHRGGMPRSADVDGRRLGEAVLLCAAREAKEELGAGVPQSAYAGSQSPLPAWLREALESPASAPRALGHVEWNALEGREKVKMQGSLRLRLKTTSLFVGVAPPETPRGFRYTALDAAKDKPKDIRAVPVSALSGLAAELGEGLGDWSCDALGSESVRLIEQASRLFACQP